MTYRCEKCEKEIILADGEAAVCPECASFLSPVNAEPSEDYAEDKGSYVHVDELLAAEQKAEEYRRMLEEAKRSAAVNPISELLKRIKSFFGSRKVKRAILTSFGVLAALAIVVGAIYYVVNYEGNLRITVNDDYVVINGFAFDKKTESLVIPSEIDGLPVRKIDDNAFLGWEGLKSVTIPESITSIGNYAF